MSAGVISCGLILFRNLLLLFKVPCYKFVGLSLCLVLPVVLYMLLISLLLCKCMLFLCKMMYLHDFYSENILYYVIRSMTFLLV